MEISDKPVNRNILYSTLSAAAFMLIVYMFSPFIGPYLASHGFTREQISYISSLAPLAIVIFSPIFGTISDYIGRKTIQRLSLLFYLIALILYLLVDHNLILLIFATILSTLFAETYLDTTVARTQDNLIEHRGKYTGIIESLKSAGALAGSLIATYILFNFPFSGVIKVVIILVGILLLLGFFVKSPPKVSVVRGSLNPLKEVWQFLKIKELRDFTALNFATSFHHPAIVIYLPLFITGELHANLWLVGLYSSAMTFGYLLQFLGGFSCERFGIGKTAVISVLCNSLVFIALAFVYSPVVVVICAFFLGLTSSFWSTSATCYISEIGERLNNEGLVVGSVASLGYLSVFISFLISGVLIGPLGLRIIFVIYGLIGIMATTFVYFRIRKNRYYSAS